MKGIGGHQSHKSIKDEWLTPPFIIDELGPFDLDPCAPINRPWDTAKYHFDISHNGLNKKWFRRVWLNPPYGKKGFQWLYKLAEHGNGIALTFARTETEGFFKTIWERADSILFIKGRLHFYHENGTRAKSNSGGPSVLVAYGFENSLKLRDCKIPGKFVSLK